MENPRVISNSRFCAKHGVGLLVYLLASWLALAVPVTFQYQGHILVDGEAVEGEGYFKFSLIEDAGSATEHAVWSNDSSVGTAGEPTQAVSLTLSRGVYSVALGDVSVANMASIDPSVFDSDGLSLRIWFSLDNVSFEQLAPDAVIASVAFAARAATAETVDSLPSGIVESSHLSESLLEILQQTPALSSDPEDELLLGEGYKRILSFNENAWVKGVAEGNLSPRMGHSGIWTGDEFLVWGGFGGGFRYFDSGGCYDPYGDGWRFVSTLGAPVGRVDHTAVWTGDSMIVWGGRDARGYLGSGGVYQVASGSWASASNDRAPSARSGHVSIWTGSTMLVWGGRGDAGLTETGAFFEPNSDVWASFSLPRIKTDAVIPSLIEEGLQVEDGSEGSSSTWNGGVDEEAPFFYQASNLAVADGYAYVTAQGDNSLSVLDVGDPLNPILIYSLLHHTGHPDGPTQVQDDVYFIDLLDLPNSVVVDGDLLIVSASDSRAISLFDISEKASLTRLSSIVGSDDGGELSDLRRPNSLKLRDGVLVVASSAKTDAGGNVTEAAAVYLFDVTDPTAPSVLSKIVGGDALPHHDDLSQSTTIDLAGGNAASTLTEHHLFITASGRSVIYVVDIEDPSAPKYVTELRDGEGGFNRIGSLAGAPLVSEDESLLVVSAGGGEDTVTLIDITTPSTPSVLYEIRDGSNGFNLLNHPIGPSLEGGVLAIASLLDSGLTLVDITDPSSPILLDQRELDGAIFSTVDNQVAYVVSNRSNSFKAVRFEYAPAPRERSAAVWANDSLLVWGGKDGGSDLADGFHLDVDDQGAPSRWVFMNDVDQPSARAGHTAVWTGTEMIVWGGAAAGVFLSDGGVYDPANLGEWRRITDEEAPSARSGHVALWTGSEMLILGGRNQAGELSDGHAYDPDSDTWRRLSQEGEPVARRDSVAAWTGEEAVVFGGISGGRGIGELEKLNPEPAIHLYRRQ